ncbi:MAG: hypothetical protein ACRDS1_05485, partial [Pseudonocardiaceae bacterium]
MTASLAGQPRHQLRKISRRGDGCLGERRDPATFCGHVFVAHDGHGRGEAFNNTAKMETVAVQCRSGLVIAEKAERLLADDPVLAVPDGAIKKFMEHAYIL